MPGDLLSVLITLFLFVAITAYGLIIWRACRPGIRAKLERYARIPLEDDPETARPAREN